MPVGVWRRRHYRPGVASLFMLADGAGNFAHSPDAAVWTAGTDPLTQCSMTEISIHAGTWFAGGGAAASSADVMMTSLDGLAWTDRGHNGTTANMFNGVYGICYSGTQWIVIANLNNSHGGIGYGIYTTTDFVTFTLRLNPFTPPFPVNPITLRRVATDGAGNCMAVGLGFTGSAFPTFEWLSTDGGTTWVAQSNTLTASGGQAQSDAPFYGDGLYLVALSRQTAAGSIATSPDGNTWTFRNPPWDGGTTANNFTINVVGKTGLLVAAGYNSAAGPVIGEKVIAYSTDHGATWTAVSTALDGLAPQLTLSGSTFLAWSGSTLITSTDGAAWTTQTQPLASITGAGPVVY